MVSVLLNSAIARLRALTNIVIRGGASPDTIGFNLMLMIAGVIAIATGASRRYGIGGAMLSRSPRHAFCV